MKKLMVFNFKMNLNYKDIRDYVENIKGKINNASFVFCPPSIFLPYFISNEYSIGLQNISEYDNGAHTGEISCQQLKYGSLLVLFDFLCRFFNHTCTTFDNAVTFNYA